MYSIQSVAVGLMDKGGPIKGVWKRSILEFYYVSHKQGRARLYRPPRSLRVVECNCASEAGSRTIGIGCIWVSLPPRVLLVIFSIEVAQEGQCGSPTPGRANFQLCFRSLEQTLGGLPKTKPKWSAICLKHIRAIGTSGVPIKFSVYF